MFRLPGGRQERYHGELLCHSENHLLELITSHSGTITGLVTPEIAKALLSINTGNRPVSKTSLDKFRSILSEGRWQNTGEPVIISREGILNDGQHRLMAVANGLHAVEMDVRFGIPRAAFPVTGTGTKRTVGNIVGIAGIANANLMAATARIIYAARLEQWQLLHTNVDPDKIIALIREEKFLGDVAALIKSYNLVKDLNQAWFAAALVLIANNAGMSLAKDFGNAVNKRIGADTCAASAFHDWLMTHKDAHIAALWRRTAKRLFIACKMFNFWVSETPVRLIKSPDIDGLTPAEFPWPIKLESCP